MVRRLGRLGPRIGWVNPPMASFLFGAATGCLALLVLSPAWLVGLRLAAESGAAVLCVRGMRFVAVPTVLAAAMLPLTGHAAAVQPAPAGAELGDAVHVLSAAMWAGGILALLTLRPPNGWPSAEGSLLLERFAPVAGIAFAVTALTGLLGASEHLTALSQLWTTPYGIVLSLKAAGVAIMAVLSALWRRGLPVEPVDATLVVGVVGATALLAVLPPPA